MGSLPYAPIAPSETPDETIRRLTAELHEALEQQAATTEILESSIPRPAISRRSSM